MPDVTLAPIERALVGWYDVNGFTVEHDGHEWFVWVDGYMLALTEIACVILEEINKARVPT